jgi:hypothetical protein
MSVRANIADGEATLTLCIGGLVTRLRLLDARPPFLAQVRDRYGAFLLPASDEPRLDCDLELSIAALPAPSPGGRLAFTEAHPLRVTAAGKAITAERWDFSFRLAGRASARRVVYRGAGRCEASPFAIDCVLRVMHATILPRIGGLLIHGCGLRHAAIGVVFPGVSGAGKTTLARKAPDSADVLSDELVAVRHLEDGWRVFGTPFWGDFARGGISMRSWPLRTVAFLAQTPDEVTIAPVVSSESTARLLGCFLAFALDRATVEQNLAVAARLCETVRSVEARLTKAASTRTIFRKLVPHLGPEVNRPVPPANAREMISDFRALLRRQKRYAFRPKTAADWVKAGDSVRVEAMTEARPADGDVVLAWMPGATADDDALACYRFDRARSRPGEVLGKVSLLSPDGKLQPLPERVGDVARSFGPLLSMPMLRMGAR